MGSIFEAVGGADALLRLAEAWRARGDGGPGFDPADPQRLTVHWAEALGGPAAYAARYGQDEPVRVVEGAEEGAREAVERFDAALDDAGIPDDETLRGALHDYVAAVALASAAPGGGDSPVPGWSWSGPVPR